MKSITVKSSDIAACPVHSMSAGHYRADGSCRCKPGFFRFSEGARLKGWRFAVDSDSSMVDDIHVLFGRGGFQSYEFRISQHDLPSAGPSLRVTVWDDGFAAFKADSEAAPLLAWFGSRRPTSLDDVQTWLSENGFVNEYKAEGGEKG